MTISKMTLTAIRQAYQIWDESKGEDIRPLLDLMAEDIQLTTLADGASPLEFSKPCHNKGDLARYFEGLLGDWDLLGTEIEEMISERNCVVVLLDTKWRNRRTEQSFMSPSAHAWHFEGDLATRIRLFFDTARWSAAARGGGYLPETD